MEYSNIRISAPNDDKIKELADKETVKRGTHISKTFILNDILNDYFNQANNESA